MSPTFCETDCAIHKHGQVLWMALLPYKDEIMHDHDDLATLTTEESIAKRKYDDAFEDFQLARRSRANNPCQGTLAQLISAQKSMQRAKRSWDDARERFEEAWEIEYRFG